MREGDLLEINVCLGFLGLGDFVCERKSGGRLVTCSSHVTDDIVRDGWSRAWVFSESGLAVRLLDLVGGRVALEPKDLVGVDDRRRWVHAVFIVGHDESGLGWVLCVFVLLYCVVQ